METIRDYWAQLSAALAATVWVVKQAIKRRKHRAEWERAMQKALLATLHNQLLFLCLQYLEAGEITADELDNLTLLYDPYVALGGRPASSPMRPEPLPRWERSGCTVAHPGGKPHSTDGVPYHRQGFSESSFGT